MLQGVPQIDLVNYKRRACFLHVVDYYVSRCPGIRTISRKNRANLHVARPCPFSQENFLPREEKPGRATTFEFQMTRYRVSRWNAWWFSGSTIFGASASRRSLDLGPSISILKYWSFHVNWTSRGHSFSSVDQTGKEGLSSMPAKYFDKIFIRSRVFIVFQKGSILKYTSDFSGFSWQNLRICDILLQRSSCSHSYFVDRLFLNFSFWQNFKLRIYDSQNTYYILIWSNFFADFSYDLQIVNFLSKLDWIILFQQRNNTLKMFTQRINMDERLKIGTGGHQILINFQSSEKYVALPPEVLGAEWSPKFWVSHYSFLSVECIVVCLP